MFRPNDDSQGLILLEEEILNYKTKELMPFSPDFVSLRKSPIELSDMESPVPLYTKQDGKQRQKGTSYQAGSKVKKYGSNFERK